MADDMQKSESRSTWELAAPGWAKWEHVFDTALAEVTETLMDRAAIGPGMRVLDVACGAGSQSIQAGKRVGPGGSVVASDISATMLEHVRLNAARAGVQNIETLESAAEDLAELHASFDAAICRMGLMLFPSPARAMQAVWHALEPGARFAALVFTSPAGNRFMAEPMGVLLRHAGKPAPAPGGPGIFALGGEGVLERMMRDSGFTDVRTETVRAPLVLPSASDAMQLMRDAAGVYRAVVADLGEEERARAWSDVHACLKQYESEDRFETELEFFIGSASRPQEDGASSSPS